MTSLAVLLIAFVLPGCERSGSKGSREAFHLPGSDFVADAAQGEKLFQASCVMCHGQTGRGTDKGPPLLHIIYRPGHHADLAFHLAVKSGVRQHHWSFGDMAPIDGLTPEQTGHIIAYVRREQQAADIK